MPREPLVVRDVLRILRHRWYVVVVGLAAAILAFVLLARAGGAYTTQNSVLFLAPGTHPLQPTEERYLEGLVGFAAAVERRVHDGRVADRLTENVTLYGAGVEEGYQVLLPNTGGQWEHTFHTPAIAVQVVGATPEWVRSTSDRLLDKIRDEAEDLQSASGVRDVDRILTYRLIDQSDVRYVGSNSGTRSRALLALAAVGTGASGAVAVLLDRNPHWRSLLLHRPAPRWMTLRRARE